MCNDGLEPNMKYNKTDHVTNLVLHKILFKYHHGIYVIIVGGHIWNSIQHVLFQLEKTIFLDSSKEIEKIKSLNTHLTIVGCRLTIINTICLVKSLA